MKPILQKQGVEKGIISFGESSILALGNHPNGKFWPLGIRDQINKNNYVHIFEAKDQTVTTSGTVVLNDEDKIENRRHIISPSSGMAVEIDGSVSVKSESATLGEFISTTWLILPENDKNILSEKLKNIEILEVNYLENKEAQTKLTILN